MSILARTIDRSPMSLIALALVLGIATANTIGSPVAATPYYIAAFCVTLFGTQILAFLHSSQAKLWSEIGLFSVFVSLGAMTYAVGTKLRANPDAWPAQAAVWRGIVSESVIRGKTERALLMIHSRWSGTEWIAANGQIECSTLHNGSSTPTLRPGDALIFKGRIETPQPNPQASFDYATYQLRHGIEGQTFAGKRFALLSPQTAQLMIQDLPFGQRWNLQWKQWRYSLMTRYQSLNLGPEEERMLQALTLGSKQQISKSLRKTYARAGASHVLALSGLHLGILMFFLLVWLRPTNRRPIPRACIVFILLCIIWSFTALTGCSTSLTRASTMYSFYLLMLLQGRRGDGVNGWATAAALLLLCNPDSLFDVGFQLSFIAVGAILLGMPFFQDWRPHNRVTRLFFDWLTLSVLAQAATLPLSVYYFHIVPSYALLSGFIAIPSAYVLLIAALLYLLFPFIGIVQTISGKIIEYTSFGMNHCLSFIAQWPFAAWEVHLSKAQLVIAYALLLVFATILVRLKKALVIGNAPDGIS